MSGKRYKSESGSEQDFVATTSFFVDQMITNKQIYTLHHSMIDLDILHTLNNCENKFGEKCKQTFDTIKNLHINILKDIQIPEDDFFKPLIGSYLVGIYNNDGNEIPIYLDVQGKFKDYTAQEYWIDYESIKSVKENKDLVYKFVKIDDDFPKKKFLIMFRQFDIYESKLKEKQIYLNFLQKEKIKSQLFNIDILTKILEINIEEKVENAVFVGISEYTRNNLPRFIFMNETGTFVDGKKNLFWPMYETKVIKVDKDGTTTPYGIYLFKKIINTESSQESLMLEDELITYNYHFHQSELSFMEKWNPYIEILYSVAFSMMIGAIIDVTSLVTSHAGKVVKHIVTPKHTSDTEPKISKSTYESDKSYLSSKHDEYKAAEEAVKNKTETSSQTDLIKTYTDKQHEVMTYAYDKGHLHKLFKDTKTQYYNNCKSAISQLVTLYPNYNFPSTPTSSMDKCQIDALNKWNEELQKGTKGIGDTDTPWWNLLSKTSTQVQDTDKLMFKQIRDNISTTHAHEKTLEYISKTNTYIDTKLISKSKTKSDASSFVKNTKDSITKDFGDAVKEQTSDFVFDFSEVEGDAEKAVEVLGGAGSFVDNELTKKIFEKKEKLDNIKASFIVENNIENLKHKIFMLNYIKKEGDTDNDIIIQQYENQIKVYEELQKLGEKEGYVEEIE